MNFIMLFKEPSFSLTDSIVCFLFISVMSFLFLWVYLVLFLIYWLTLSSLILFFNVFLQYAFKIINIPLRMDSAVSHSFWYVNLMIMSFPCSFIFHLWVIWKYVSQFLKCRFSHYPLFLTPSLIMLFLEIVICIPLP